MSSNVIRCGDAVTCLRTINMVSIKSGGYIRFVCDSFPDTENAKRLPQSKISDAPKPFLQWVGGKRKMILQYADLIPKQYGTYWEPFLGGGALFFHLNPQRSVINDSNMELVKTYEAIRDNPEEVINLLSLLRRKHSKELYIAIRAADRHIDFLKDLHGYEVAARMIYLNQTCFNAVYRVNKNGQFNVSIGSTLNRVICDAVSIQTASKSLQNDRIISVDFEEALIGVEAGDFVYLDPPYYPVSGYSDFNRYTKEKFYQKDQVRLRDTFNSLTQKDCYVMLSNSDCDFIRGIYSDFNIHTVYSDRNLNSKAAKRGKIAEVLITNY